MRQLFLRFGEANLDYIEKKSTDFLSNLIKIYREKSQKVHKLKSFVVPVSMTLLPYFIYSFLRSAMIDKKHMRKHVLIEYHRRELMKCPLSTFILFFAPEVYEVGFYWYGEADDKFVLPPKFSLVDFVPDKNRNPP